MRNGKFLETLPPMIESRESPSAVSSGSALVVAGGEDTSGELSSVEVYKDGQWTTGPFLPSAGCDIKSALHGDQWYLITSLGKVFRTSLQSLISGSDQSPWETLPDAPNSSSDAAFFGGRLLSIGGGDDPDQTTNIYAFSTHTQSWQHVNKLSVPLSSPTAVVISIKKLVVINFNKVFYGKLKLAPFDAHSHFTMRAIDCLKVSTGISLIEELVQHMPTTFPAVAGVDVQDMYDDILEDWALGYGSHPPTWTKLFRGLKEMGLSELVGRMENSLRGLVTEDPPRPPPDEESDSKEEKDEQEILRLNSVLAEHISANTLLKKASNNQEQEIARLKEQLDSEATSGNDLPGVDVLARTSTIITTNSAYTFHWVGYGFKLTIPHGSLPAGVDQCRLDIVASAAGQYQFPYNLKLVSGVFWIHPYPLCRFQRQLTVEIQHCVKITSSTKLSFVRACCSQKHLPYTFKQLEGRSSFTEHSSYGSLELNHFSGLAVTGEDVEREYIASLYYQQCDPRTLEIHFVITWDTRAHIHATKEHFEELGAKERSHLEVEFKKNKIILDIPMNGGVTIGAWNLLPTVTPCIL